VAVLPVSTIEEFRHQMIQVADTYRAESDKKPILVILDSLGNLSTIKEMEDTASGKNVRDMTKAQALKATFRTLTVKCGSAGIPLLITNHTYDVVGSYVPMKEMSGGSGLKYNAGTIVFLSKKKVKDGTDVVGNIIKCKLQKSRVTKENSIAETLLNYESGLSPYYGLTDIAVKHGVFKKVSTRIELPDGKKVYEKQINENPEKYFTDSVMEQLEVAVAKEFKYGSSVEDEVEEIKVEDAN
jgi:RecA/RadA recombinase